MDERSLQMLAALLGAAMGFLYAFSGFGDQGKAEEFQHNPRVKNLIWLVGGGAAAVFADWKLLIPNGGPDLHAKMLFWYLVIAIAVVLGAIVTVALSIFLSVRARSVDAPAFRGHAVDLVLEYVTYGYKAYKARRAEIEAAATRASDAAAALARQGATLSGLVAAIAADRRGADPLHRERLIDQTLEAIEGAVQLFMIDGREVDLRANYMRRVDAAGLNGVRPHFTHGALSEYDGFLLLRRYRDHGGDPIGLPIPRQDCMAQLLPGAPMAVVQKRPLLLDPRKLTFRKGVPKNVQKEVRAYFADVAYRSVLSVPMTWDRRVIGVINVESSHADLVGRGSDIVNGIGRTLAPYCVIMAELVMRADGAIP